METGQNIVKEYLNALTIAIERGGTTQFWPFGPGQVDSYFIDLLAVNIFEKFKDNPGKFKKALNILSPNILRWFLVPFVILGLKLARKYESYAVTTPQMVNFIKAVGEVLEEKVNSDPFCLDEKNIILSEKEIDEAIRNSYWFDGKERKIINFLSLDLESFVWGINFDLFAYGVYWHGPYSLNNGKTILIKKFFDLNLPIWKLNVPYSQIEILFIFNGEVNATMDFMNHMAYSENIWDKLDGFAVKVDSHLVKNLEEIKNLSDFFSKKRNLQVRKVNQLSPEKLIIKGTEIYYYMFHDFFEYYHEPWQPPKEFEKRLKEWGLKYWHQFKSQKETKKQPADDFFQRLYDPRNNFTD